MEEGTYVPKCPNMIRRHSSLCSTQSLNNLEINGYTSDEDNNSPNKWKSNESMASNGSQCRCLDPKCQIKKYIHRHCGQSVTQVEFRMTT